MKTSYVKLVVFETLKTVMNSWNLFPLELEEFCFCSGFMLSYSLSFINVLFWCLDCMLTITHWHIVNMHWTLHSFLYHSHMFAWVVAQSRQQLLWAWSPIGSYFANLYYIIYETHKSLLNTAATKKNRPLLHHISHDTLRLIF
jgi:hypothetical protein